VTDWLSAGGCALHGWARSWRQRLLDKRMQTKTLAEVETSFWKISRINAASFENAVLTWQAYPN